MNRGDYQNILDNREKRAYLIHRSLHSTRRTLVEVTLNIPGREKDSLLYRAVHMEMLTRILPVMDARLVYLEYMPEGPFALLNTALSPLWVKNIAVTLEEDTPEGRVFDIDVFQPDGTKVGRSGPLRSCYLCDDSASVCARLQRHTQEQLQRDIKERIQVGPSYKRVEQLTGILSMDRYHAVPYSLASDRASTIGRLAQQALVQEVALTPKPGLVDGYDTGSHVDMDIQTFLRSATALGETFFRIAHTAMVCQDADLPTLFPVLRQIGIDGERSMFDATDNVNTHKGMIFSCGL
ncbi:MAG: citrate lyase holo-[acyl-carrier protein] synthase, partial [Sphaerochaetaceae bacterium]|nr:citrate lyase holo-[acyl-carrier protein] synthase [Sphaerochaetaceae bacterium]